MTECAERPGFIDILDQDELWWPATGESLRLEDMGPRHRRNTLAWIRRQAPTLWMVIVATAIDRVSDGVMDDLRGVDAETWVEDMPLVARLRDLVAADEAAGVPDEPDERIGKPLPCASWCQLCKGQTFEPGAPLPCAYCPDCTAAVAAADDATWD